MIDAKLIERIRRDREISKMDFYKLIGMSSTGYNQMFENNSMKIVTLEKIAEVLSVSPVDLLAESSTELIAEPRGKYSKEDMEELRAENLSLLKETNRLKDEIINLQKEIAVFKEQKGMPDVINPVD